MDALYDRHGRVVGWMHENYVLEIKTAITDVSSSTGASTRSVMDATLAGSMMGGFATQPIVLLYSSLVLAVVVWHAQLGRRGRQHRPVRLDLPAQLYPRVQLDQRDLGWQDWAPSAR